MLKLIAWYFPIPYIYKDHFETNKKTLKHLHKKTLPPLWKSTVQNLSAPLKDLAAWIIKFISFQMPYIIWRFSGKDFKLFAALFFANEQKLAGTINGQIAARLAGNLQAQLSSASSAWQQWGQFSSVSYLFYIALLVMNGKTVIKYLLFHFAHSSCPISFTATECLEVRAAQLAHFLALWGMIAQEHHPHGQQAQQT